jgi:RimJ/RimL family protein N-acetyltransferase
VQAPTIDTERLRLRALTPDDVDNLAALYADPDVMRYVGNGQPLPRERAEFSVDRAVNYWWKEHNFGPWVIELRDTGEFVGRCTIQTLQDGPEVEVGYILAKPHWGKGYATEATRALLAYGFDTAGLNRIVAITYPENTPSQHVLEKAGLKFEKMAHYLDTEVCYFAITREMYEDANQPPQNLSG